MRRWLLAAMLAATLLIAGCGGHARRLGGIGPCVQQPSGALSCRGLDNVTAPAISGSASQGSTLSASTGTWNTIPSSFTYQWWECDASGLNCQPLAGATQSTYTLGSGDAGHTLLVRVLASQGPRSTSADSAPTAVVSSGSANLWVSTTAGTCTRSATPAAFNASTACGSLGAAYAAASCGDLVYIKGGSYVGALQTITDSPTKDSTCSQPVTLEGFPGETATFSQINTGQFSSTVGASWWTLDNVTLSSNGAFPAYISIETNGTGGTGTTVPTNITIENVTGGGLNLGELTNSTVEFNTLGPCFSDGIGNQSASHPCVTDETEIGDTSSNITYAHNTILGMTHTTNHSECMFVTGGSNITIDSNKFTSCVGYPVGVEPDAPISGLTIENNWFEAGTQAASEQAAVNFSGGAGLTGTNILLRYNSTSANIGTFGTAFSISSGASDYTNMRVIGNIGENSAGNCHAGWTYAFNIWTSTPCVASDATGTLPYVSGTAGSEDFHLTCGSVAHNFVTPNAADYQLNYDIDGNARNSSGPREAGASAEASCGT